MPNGTFAAADLKPALIDFYILSQGIPSQFNSSPILQQHRLATINSWKRTLIRDIEFCIACELRHIDDNTAKPYGGPWPHWFQSHFGDIGSLWYSKWKSLKSSPTLPQSKDPEFNDDLAYVMHINASNSKKRKGSYLAGKSAELQHGLSLIEVCCKAFDPGKVKWGGAFGGKAWQRIAQTLLALWHAIDLTEIVHLIDTAFALHHNTNIVFNKNKIWAGGSAYSWIQQWLDYKWAAHSPVSLLGLASPQLQGMVQYVGFQMGTDFSPKTLVQKDTPLPPGQAVVLEEDGKQVTAVIVEAPGRYFKSVVLKSPQWKVQKVFGKYAKELNMKIYSHEEFLVRLKATQGFNLSKAMQGIKKSTGKVGKTFKKFKKSLVESPTYQAFLHYKSILHSVYEKMSEYVIGKGYTLGSFLEDGQAFRFRLKGHSQPLRFYFVVDFEGNLEVRKGLTAEEDVTASKLLLKVTKKETDKILPLLKGVVEAHLGITPPKEVGA